MDDLVMVARGFGKHKGWGLFLVNKEANLEDTDWAEVEHTCVAR
jgi:hypothetical protein